MQLEQEFQQTSLTVQVPINAATIPKHYRLTNVLLSLGSLAKFTLPIIAEEAEYLANS